jgi:hypothetical protein
MKAMLKNTTNIIIAIASLLFLTLTLKPILLTEDPLVFAAKVDQQMAPMEAAQFAKRFFADIRARDLEAAKSALDPKVVDSQIKEKLSAVANIFPIEAPKSIKFSGFREIKADGVFSNVTIYMQYEYSDRWILATARLQKLGGNFVVASAEAQPNRDSIENFNKFKFLGQDVKHYAVFIAAISLLLFGIYVFALCIKEVASRPKSVGPWLWIIFVLVGFGKVEFNWINGMFYFFQNSAYANSSQGHAIELFEFPVARFSLSPQTPLVVMMSVPLGAIIFLLRRKKVGRSGSV